LANFYQRYKSKMDDHRRQSRCKNCNAEVVAGYMKRKKRQLIKEMFKKKNEVK